MEFSYRISEKEFGRVQKLHIAGRSSSARKKTVLFWVFILICLMLLWGVVQRTSPNSPPAHPQPIVHSSRSDGTWTALLPFAAVLGLWVVAFGGARALTRRLYQSDPMMQGEFTVSITPQSIAMRNSAGVTAQWTWNLYDFWRERECLIALALRSGTFIPLNLAGLPDIQRHELRTILEQVLRKR
jgi:hypothetical protein